MTVREANFDALVGPTHNYAGLSHGNLASEANRSAVSHPRAAALQGLAKMKLVADLRIRQGVLPPQERPDLRILRRLGFEGSDAAVLQKVQREAPILLGAAASASGMWAANAATVSASADAADARVHFTPANLITLFHRSLEAETTAGMLRAIFSDGRHFAHHPPLPASMQFSDEGAANHTRLCRDFGQEGLELFAFGRRAFEADAPAPVRYPARQTLEASQAIARLHQLDPARTVFLQQNPAAIDAGVFHNDVIAVGNANVLLYHAEAYLDGAAAIEKVRRRYGEVCQNELITIEVTASELTLADAVRSYLFNSQLLSLADGQMVLLAPIECKEIDTARRVIERVLSAGTPIKEARFVDVRQSMRNGGGPACLRLRVVLTEEQAQAVAPRVWLTDELYGTLTDWIERHYREELSPADLADPDLLKQSHAALDELTGILGLGSIYPFQRINSLRSITVAEDR